MTNSSPPTLPAKETVPASVARIGVPGAAAMSIPRWPAPNGVSGGSNPRITGPCTGQAHVPTGSIGTIPMRSIPEPIGDGPADGKDGPVRVTITRGKTSASNAMRFSDR